MNSQFLRVVSIVFTATGVIGSVGKLLDLLPVPAPVVTAVLGGALLLHQWAGQIEGQGNQVTSPTPGVAVLTKTPNS